MRGVCVCVGVSAIVWRVSRVLEQPRLRRVESSQCGRPKSYMTPYLVLLVLSKKNIPNPTPHELGKGHLKNKRTSAIGIMAGRKHGSKHTLS